MMRLNKAYTRWLVSPAIVIVSLLLLALSHRSQSFATWYAANLYPILPHTIGRFFSLFSFSVFEIVLILLVLLTIYGASFFFISLCTSKGRARLWYWVKTCALTTLRRLMNIAATLLLFFVLGAGINYNRESYAEHVGIVVEDSSVNELIQLYMILVERAELIAPQIEADANGRFVLQRDSVHEEAQRAMMELNDLHGGLIGYFPRAKGWLLSREILSNMRIAGVFTPWTMEGNYNADMPVQSIPFVIVHELAHVAGHMREDEANFIAYLAARNVDNVDFNYSAVYTALSYTLNALRRSLGAQQHSELFAMLPEQLQRDFTAAREYWQAFEGPVADMSNRMNDAYLRMNQQEDGVQSYGRMIDLLLAYYRSENRIVKNR